MKPARLGQTDLIVSQVGFGGIPIIPLDTDEAISVVRHCFESGINFFDTAHMYHDSEEKIGVALLPVRDDVILATKTTERSAAAASAQIDLSLQRLQTDRIDLYQLHNVSNEDALQKVLAPGGAYEAVDQARRRGKVRYVGISSHNMAIAAKALKTGLFQTLQFPFNFIENDPADALFPLARQLDVGIIGMKPMGGGLLGKAGLCFGFLQQHPDVMPIPGIRAVEEADEIVGLYRAPRPLAEADRTAMDTIRAALGKTFCHRCEYCMPCEQGVQISSVLIYPAFVKRFSTKVAASTPFMQSALKSAAECIECGQCEERCPYNLPIIDLLKETLALYKASL